MRQKRKRVQTVAWVVLVRLARCEGSLPDGLCGVAQADGPKRGMHGGSALSPLADKTRMVGVDNLALYPKRTAVLSEGKVLF